VGGPGPLSCDQGDSGGAPIAPATVERFQLEAGAYIHNIFGSRSDLTVAHERSDGGHAPTDPNRARCRSALPILTNRGPVIDEEGNASTGELGDSSPWPAVSSAVYWNKPERRPSTPSGRNLHTGTSGSWPRRWYYSGRPQKDFIIRLRLQGVAAEAERPTSNPAWREPPSSGGPREYRGESVKASSACGPARSHRADLIAFCKERMSAYSTRARSSSSTSSRNRDVKNPPPRVACVRRTGSSVRPPRVVVRILAPRRPESGPKRGAPRHRTGPQTVSARSTGLSTLPPALRGSGSGATARTCALIGDAASAKARISSAVTVLAGRGRTTAPTFPPPHRSGDAARHLNTRVLDERSRPRPVDVYLATPLKPCPSGDRRSGKPLVVDPCQVAPVQPRRRTSPPSARACSSSPATMFWPRIRARPRPVDGSRSSRSTPPRLREAALSGRFLGVLVPAERSTRSQVSVSPIRCRGERFREMRGPHGCDHVWATSAHAAVK